MGFSFSSLTGGSSFGQFRDQLQAPFHGGSISGAGYNAIHTLDPTISTDRLINSASAEVGGGEIFGQSTMADQAAGFNTVGQAIAAYYGGQYLFGGGGAGSSGGSVGGDAVSAGSSGVTVSGVGGDAVTGSSVVGGAGGVVGTGATSAGGSAAGGATSTGGMSTTGNFLNLLNSLYQGSQAGGAASAAAGAADPFASQRGMYQTMLRQLMTDPNMIMQSPIYQTEMEAGIDAVNRTAGAKGQLTSGNRLTALQKYGSGVAADVFSKYAGLLSTLSGATTGSPAAAGQAIQGGASQQSGYGAQAMSYAIPLIEHYFSS